MTTETLPPDQRAPVVKVKTKPRRPNGEAARVERKQPAALARQKARQAVAVQEPQAPPPSQVDNALAIIERASRDPTVDVSKMVTLMAMAKELRADEARLRYIAAFNEMQPELPIIPARGRIVIPPKDGKAGQVTSYAKWEDISTIINPILHSHGFNLTHRSGMQPDGRVIVRAILSHAAGHQEETELVLPIENSGSKNNVQGIGSSLSYGKRYTATFLLNIVTSGEDDDGQAAGSGEKAEREDPYAEEQAKPPLRPKVSEWMTKTLENALATRDIAKLEEGLEAVQKQSLWREALDKDPEGTAQIKRRIEDHITVLKEG